MTVEELQRIISDEQAELEAIAAVRPSPVESFAQYEMIRRLLVGHQRQLCLLLHQDAVLPLPDWSFHWNQRHTDVRLLSRELWKAWFAFECLGDQSQRRAVLCEFKHALAARYTSIDYDNLEQHPLSRAGLEGIGAYVVECSQWISELRRENDSPESTHFLFCFSSCLVECVAEGIDVVSEANSVTRVWQSIPTD